MKENTKPRQYFMQHEQMDFETQIITEDPSRRVPTWKKHIECFDAFCARLDPPAEKIEIPREDTGFCALWPSSAALRRAWPIQA